MKKFFIIILCLSLWTSSLTHARLCSKCSRGPIFLRKYFTLYDDQVTKLYVENHKVYINNFNSSTAINLLKIVNNNSICDMNLNEVYDNQETKLFWLNNIFNKSTNFSAIWLVSITWMAVGESPNCSASNFYQLVLTTDGKRNILLLIINNLRSLDKQYTIGITTKNFKKTIELNGIELVSKSNINVPGMWVLYNETISISNNSKSLRHLNFYLINFIALILLTNN